MFGLGVVVCLSVGYGFGTLMQFDHDWREAPPVLVASAEGAVAQGTPIDQAIEDLLADSPTVVHAVQCPDPADAVGGEQLCRAATSTGMVSILASTSPGLLRLQVYAPA